MAQPKGIRKLSGLLVPFVFLTSCSNDGPEPALFDFYLAEPSMIINQQQDNTLEGDYLRVTKVESDSVIEVSLPLNFYLSHNQSNSSSWVIGWGTGKPLYDAGVENIRQFAFINTSSGKVKLGKLLRGEGFPEEGQRVVFWNTAPSGFEHYQLEPVINPLEWPDFNGRSVSFGAVVFDSSLHQWVMPIYETDSRQVQIYAAVSTNLIDWKPENGGRPILTAADFIGTSWAGWDKTGSHPQAPFVSDLIRHNKQWYLFLHGYNKSGKRSIGLAVSDSSVLGPYEILKEPILLPDEKWNAGGVFYAKVAPFKDGFIMAYDGKNKPGKEQVGIAFSDDLVKWENSQHNPVISDHDGWRSSPYSSEPAFVQTSGDTIWMIVAGTKKFKMGWWHHYVTRRMYKDKSGNVDDPQLGVYKSTDGGKNFIPHIHNPVFVNDYTNPYENEHLGGNFQLIETDTMDFLFYQAKSSFEGLKYNIMLRVQEQ